KSWTEPQPFGWQGRYFQYRTVSVWPRPLQQPFPPTYALGISRESCELAARNKLGLGVSYGPFEVMAKSTNYYRQQAVHYVWEPGPDDIIYRANMILGETDAEAEKLYQERAGIAPFPVRAGLRDALLEADKRNVAGEARPANVGGVLPTTLMAGPDPMVTQSKGYRARVAAGGLNLHWHPPWTPVAAGRISPYDLFGNAL